MPNSMSLHYICDNYLILIKNIFFNPKNGVEIKPVKSSGVYKFCKQLIC